MKSLPASLPKSLARSFGAGIVALLVLFPKTTQAEAVEDGERRGEYEEEGLRFGAIIVKGELVATANAPGGWSLVRTYENKSDEVAEATLEERIMSEESMVGARVNPPAKTVLTRTQTFRLGPHEKKSIGTYLPAALGVAMTKAHHTESWARNQLALEDGDDGDVTYNTYGVSYYRALEPGQTAAVHKPAEGEWVATKPARIPDGRMSERLTRKAKAQAKGGTATLDTIESEL